MESIYDRYLNVPNSARGILSGRASMVIGVTIVLVKELYHARDGNLLKKVTDQCEELTYAGAMDFKDGANKQVEYTWDANGNMTSDLNKGLTEIQYNVLNLPENESIRKRLT